MKLEIGRLASRACCDRAAAPSWSGMACCSPYWEALFVQTEYERLVTALRNTLDEDTFAAEVAKGQTMTVEQAIAYGQETQKAQPSNDGHLSMPMLKNEAD